MKRHEPPRAATGSGEDAPPDVANIADADLGREGVDAWSLSDSEIDADTADEDADTSTEDSDATSDSEAVRGASIARESLNRDQELELVAAARRGDMAARERLVRANYWTLAWIAKRYRASGVPHEDLISEGVIGMLAAIDRFDASRGTRFETYARWWVLDAVRTCVMRQSRTVRLPANVVREIGSIERLLKSAEGSDGALGQRSRSSVIDRVAQRLRRSGNHVEQMLALKEPTLPLDSIAERPHDDGVSDGSPRASPWSPEAMVAMKQMMGHLMSLLGELSERERTVLVARYGLETGVPASLEELAGRLGLTAERVRQIQKEATVKLRARFVERRLLPAEGATPAPAAPSKRK